MHKCCDTSGCIFMHLLSTLCRDLHEVEVEFASSMQWWTNCLSYFEHACVVTYRGAYLFSELSTYLKRWSDAPYETELEHWRCVQCRVCRPQISWSNAVEPVRPTWQLFSAPDPTSKVLLLTQMLYRHIFLVRIYYYAMHPLCIYLISSGSNTRLFLYIPISAGQF